jgi:hypothetical protein
LPVPDEAKRKPQATGLKDAVEGSEPISVLSQLRQQPSPATTFQLLKDAVQGYSPVSILSRLTVRFLFVRRDEFHEESSEIHHHHAYIEFLTAFLATQPFPTGELKDLKASRCDEIWQRLKDYYTAVQRDLMADALEQTEKLHKLAFDAKNHSLMVRGGAYPHQLEQMAVALYGEHDDWFQEILGFTSARRCTRCGRRWSFQLGDTTRCYRRLGV